MDSSSNPIQESQKKKRHRPDKSQRFPSIPLPKAIDRIKELYGLASDSEVHVVTAGKAWGYSEKSSAIGGVVAALKAFGLVEDSGSKQARKVKLTDNALRIIRDPRTISPDRDALIKKSALMPLIHHEIIDMYGGMPPSDEALQTHLLLDRGFKEEAVHEFMKEFDATMSFAKISDASTMPDDGLNNPEEPDDNPAIAIGDFVQWTNSGQNQFNPVRRVVWISPDNSHLRVDGSNTGIPIDEVTLSEPPQNPPVPDPQLGQNTGNLGIGGGDIEKNDIKVLLDGDQLQVSALVDIKGLRRLKKMLTKYEEILNMNEDEEENESGH